MAARMLMFQARASSAIAAGVLLLPWVLLMIPVMVLAITSLVVPSRRQCHLLDVLDRLVKIAAALRGSDKVGPQKPRPSSEVVPLISRSLLVKLEQPPAAARHNTAPATGTGQRHHGNTLQEHRGARRRRQGRRLVVPSHCAEVSAEARPAPTPELASHACESPRRPQRDRTGLSARLHDDPVEAVFVSTWRGTRDRRPRRVAGGKDEGSRPGGLRRQARMVTMSALVVTLVAGTGFEPV